jgi:hypothetical protein
MRWHLALLTAAVLLVGCGGSVATEVAGPCDALADEMVAAIAIYTAAIDAQYPGLKLATLPTDPPPPEVRRFMAQMQRLEAHRSEVDCEAAQLVAELRERAHRIRGDGYMATAYRIGLEHGALQQPLTEEVRPMVVPSARHGSLAPGPPICTARWCRYIELTF